MAKKEKQMKAAEAERLRSMFPGIYNDLSAGRIVSKRIALELAGLLPPRSRLQKLQHSWKKATPGERQTFIEWLMEQGALQEPAPIAPAATAFTGPIANGRYLLPETILRIEAIMTKRQLKPDQIMQAMGFGSHDRSLLRAMARKTSLRLKVIEALGNWLAEQETGEIKP